MKIRCEACDRDEEEASLYEVKNKLAGKHQRLSLHHPSPKQAPLHVRHLPGN